MKAYDLICLGNLSFGIFRAPELRYHMGQYLKKPTSNRVKQLKKESEIKKNQYSITNDTLSVDLGSE